MLARPTCGKNAGGIAHHVHNQTGIVGDCRAARTCGHIAGLEQRVLLEGHSVFHRIRQIQRTGRHQLHLIHVHTQTIFQNAVDFNEFALVMRCDDDSHVPIPFVAVRCFVDVGLPDVRLTCPDLPTRCCARPACGRLTSDLQPSVLCERGLLRGLQFLVALFRQVKQRVQLGAVERAVFGSA